MDLKVGSLDFILHLNISNKESLLRSLGLRYDRVNHMTYHLRDNAPPVDNAPLLERIEKDYSDGIVYKNIEVENNLPDLKQFY